MRLATRYGWRASLWHAFTQHFSLALTCASGVALVVSTGLGTWLLAGPSIAGIGGHPFPQPAPLRLAIACALFAVVVFALLMQTVEAAVRDVREARARSRALHGDAAAMPLARTAPFSGEVPNVTRLPLEGLVSPVGPSRRVSADNRGLRVRGLYGGERVVRWEDARLLEVAAGNDGKSLVYALRGRGRPITWSDRRPAGVSAEARLAYQRLSAQMLAVVHARTGLSPRTCVPALQAGNLTEQPTPTETAAPKRRGPLQRLTHASGVVAGGIVVFAFAGGLAWAAYICVALPLTSVLAWNIYAATTLAAIPFLLLWVVGRFLLKSTVRRRRSSIPGVLPNLPPAPAPGRYALRWRDPWWHHALGVLVGVVFALDGVPLAIDVAESFGNADATVFLPPGIVVGQVLFLFALLGVMVAIASAVTWPRAVADLVVDDAGLMGDGTIIPWGQVERFTWHGKVSNGTFEASSIAGMQTLAWPERPARVLPAHDGSPITPTELAALVAERSGKSLQLAGEQP